MLKRLVSSALSRIVRDPVRQAVRFHWAYFPHEPRSSSYLLPRVPEEAERHPSSPWPIPPEGLRIYGGSTEEWLALGREHAQGMRALVEQNGMALETAGRILDFGCREGRMIRWLDDVADRCEVWGVDVSASHVLWCKQHLSPPFHFATTTLFPHLPFEDRTFGLVYAGSVFTHIEDLADAWFQELRRVLRPGGLLYVTIHDEHTLDLFNRRDHPTRRALERHPEYAEYAGSEFGMFTLGRHAASQVFYDVGYLEGSLAPFFRTRAVVKEAYSYQTALLLERL